ncbi:olfactory receptor 1361-like [Rhinatrema bivittatum]|uniref:olfactory receptor 1361-like n=1 Tax=Rhinatrema bivittatum TaxID=194408 RepID=UPI001128AE8F|nr:olfactory receptor 1361-like [Rhinatrema bivittatum]
MAVLGNLLIICIVCADPHLHTPMYFFLANLSIIDICFLTVTVPKLLAVLLTENNAISFSDCILQMYCYVICVATEFTLLAVMAYDRYVAICNPLRYTIIMTRRICALLAAFSWAAGFIEGLPQVIIISRFSFCSSNEIVHFFCDFSALMKLSCSETSTIELLNYIEGVFTDLTPFVLTLTSYVLHYGSWVPQLAAPDIKEDPKTQGTSSDSLALSPLRHIIYQQSMNKEQGKYKQSEMIDFLMVA